jgi:superfamily II DNA or RNA helicase
VYCNSRERTGKEYEAGLKTALRLGYKPILYHAQIPQEDKVLAMELFRQADNPLVFCTVAFGMGIDRPDIRRVIHFDAPISLVDFAQQIGRAGRDNQPAECITFYDARKLIRTQAQYKSTVPSIEFVENIHKRLGNAWIKSGKRPDFGLSGFMKQYELMLPTGDMAYPEVVVSQMKTSLALLLEVGVANDEENGFTLKKLVPGSAKYLRLLELTEMKVKRMVRETARMRRFFEVENPTQELLWNLIGEE